MLHEWRRAGGNKDRILACQRALRYGGNVTEICDDFYENFMNPMQMHFSESGCGDYDIAHPDADPFPPPHMYGYLMQESVLRALGVPVNFTAVSWPVNAVFSDGTFDFLRGGFVESIAHLLDGGVKVHMMYGDRYASSPFLPPSHAAEL
jgi:hypothetical protein